MKIGKLLAGGILLIGAIISLHNSATNYGLATNSLHPSVASQSNGTSGDDTSGDSTSGNKIISFNQIILQTYNDDTKQSDNEGKITSIKGIIINNCKANTLYQINYIANTCINVPNEFCEHSLQGIKVISITEVGTTSGDGTN